MKVLIALALAFALVFTLRTVAGADEDDATPKPTQFRPWQEVWQCNDIRLTVTGRAPFEIEYDLAARSGAVAASLLWSVNSTSTGILACDWRLTDARLAQRLPDGGDLRRYLYRVHGAAAGAGWPDAFDRRLLQVRPAHCGG